MNMSDEAFKLNDAAKAIAAERLGLMTDALKRAYDALHSVWDNLGIPAVEADERALRFVDLIRTTAESVKRGEARMEAEAVELNTELGREIDELYGELGIDNSENYANIQPDDKVFELKVKLEMELNRLVGIKDEMLEGVRGLKEREEALCAVLDMPELAISADRVPKAEQVRELESHVKMLEDDKVRRIRELRERRDQAKALWEELGCAPEDGFQSDFYNDQLRLSKENLKNAEKCVETLKNQVARMKEGLEQRKKELELLWSRLDYNQFHVDVFREKYYGIKPEQMSALDAELRKLREEKAQKLGQFIDNVRLELRDLGDKLMYGPQAFAQLDQYTTNEPPSQQVLEKLEDVANKMRQELDARQTLLRKVQKWMALIADHERVEAESKDPNRFNNRGGNLLALQTEQRKLKKAIPDTYYKLRQEILDWQIEHEQEFFVNDERFIHAMEEQFGKTAMGKATARVPLAAAASASKTRPLGPPSTTKASQQKRRNDGTDPRAAESKGLKGNDGSRSATANDPAPDMTLESVPDFSTFRTGLDSAAKARQARAACDVGRLQRAGQGLKALARAGAFRSPLPSRIAATTPFNDIYNHLTSTQVMEASPSKKTVFPKQA